MGAYFEALRDLVALRIQIAVAHDVGEYVALNAAYSRQSLLCRALMIGGLDA